MTFTITIGKQCDTIEHMEHKLIQAIHDAPSQACLVVTGAGTSAISVLFAVAGASRTVIDAQIPYAISALHEYVGQQKAGQHVSVAEAKLMAEKAYQRVCRLVTDDADKQDTNTRLIGLSCTAAIATDRKRRGENRCHIAWHDGQNGATYSLVMQKDARDRALEEAICKKLILNALAESFQLNMRLDIELMDGEFIERATY